VTTPIDRPRLRRALLEAEPWLGATDHGPQAVDAGACDRCGHLPRLLPTCGPEGLAGVCRPCARELGTAAWCDGHLADAEAALSWADGLPDHWDLVVTLWWIATGEARLDSLVDLRADGRLPAGLRHSLGTG
jgi:hypothetical protein